MLPEIRRRTIKALSVSMIWSCIDTFTTDGLIRVWEHAHHNPGACASDGGWQPDRPLCTYTVSCAPFAGALTHADSTSF